MSRDRNERRSRVELNVDDVIINAENVIINADNVIVREDNDKNKHHDHNKREDRRGFSWI